MDAEHGVPIVLAQVHQHPVTGDAGVVDHDVESTPRVQGGADEAIGAVGRRGVGDVADRLSPGGGERRHRLPHEVAVDVVDHHEGALGDEGLGVGPPDPPAGAGDDAHAPVDHADRRRQRQSHGYGNAAGAAS